MIPAVVVALALVTSTIALPFTTQEHLTTATEGVSQTHTRIPLTSVPQHVEKTGLPSFSGVCTQTGQAFQPILQQAEKSTPYFGAPEELTGSNTAQQVVQGEKTGIKAPAEAQNNLQYAQYNPQNTPASKVENVPSNVEQTQPTYSEPIQPLSVIPVSQVDEVFRPVIVPAEPIAAKRVIIMAVEPIQQRNFQQNVIGIPEKQLPYQQLVQPVTYTPVQTQKTEPNQQTLQQEIQSKGQNYIPVQVQFSQEPLIREQPTPNSYAEKQIVDTPSHYNQVPAVFSSNTHSVSPKVQVDDTVSTEKEVPYQAGSDYTPVQVQPLEFNSKQQPELLNQQVSEKQVLNQQGSEYSPVQSQAYDYKPVSVEKQEPFQQPNLFQNAEATYQEPVQATQQVGEKQAQHPQVNSYKPVQNQPTQESSVQSIAVEQNQKQGQSQQSYSVPQTALFESQQQQVQPVQQAVEKQVPSQQPIQTANSVPVQVHPVGPAYQQVYSAQPTTTGQVENQVSYQQPSQSETAGYVSEKITKSSEAEQNEQVFGIQPQEVVNYSGELGYNFGDRVSPIQQNVFSHSQSKISQTQDYTVQPPVGSTQ